MKSNKGFFFRGSCGFHLKGKVESMTKQLILSSGTWTILCFLHPCFSPAQIELYFFPVKPNIKVVATYLWTFVWKLMIWCTYNSVTRITILDDMMRTTITKKTSHAAGSFCAKTCLSFPSWQVYLMHLRADSLHLTKAENTERSMETELENWNLWNKDMTCVFSIERNEQEPERWLFI